MQTRGPAFHPLPSTASYHFQVTAELWDKFTEWPENGLIMFKVKRSRLNISLYDEPFTSYGPIFRKVCFTLRWAFIRYGEILRTPPNDHDMFEAKSTPYQFCIQPQSSNFCLFRYTMSRFGAIRISWGPNVSPFNFTWDGSKLRPNFEKKCPIIITKWLW